MLMMMMEKQNNMQQQMAENDFKITFFFVETIGSVFD
jgi:hypothetical protein